MQFVNNVCVEKCVKWNFRQISQKKKLGDVSNHNLSKICDMCNVSKRRFNDANVILTTCNDRQYWSKRTSKGLQAVASTERLPAFRPASFSFCSDVFDKSWVFCAICWNYHFESTNCDLTHRESTKCYATAKSNMFVHNVKNRIKKRNQS